MTFPGGVEKGGPGEGFTPCQFLTEPGEGGLEEEEEVEALPGRPDMAQLVKILCKGGDNLYVSIRGKDVVLAHEDPRDKTQQWFQDYSRSCCVTDDNGQRSFALVNKATRQVMVNRNWRQSYEPMQLAPYDDDERVRISMLWTQLEEEHGDGFHQIAVLKDISNVLDGLKGNVEGTIVGYGPTHYRSIQCVKDNQLWKILPVVGGSSTYFTNST